MSNLWAPTTASLRGRRKDGLRTISNGRFKLELGLESNGLNQWLFGRTDQREFALSTMRTKTSGVAFYYFFDRSTMSSVGSGSGWFSILFNVPNHYYAWLLWRINMSLRSQKSCSSPTSHLVFTSDSECNFTPFQLRIQAIQPSGRFSSISHLGHGHTWESNTSRWNTNRWCWWSTT